MPKKQRTPAQVEADKARMAAIRAKKQTNQTNSTVTAPPATEPPKVPEEDLTDHIAGDQDLSDLIRQMKEIQETNALLKAALLGNQSNSSNQVGIGKDGKLLGEVDKYVVDEAGYKNPIERLKQENRLKQIAFDHNYELEYSFATSNYETKTGVNMREPRFHITLNRVVLDDQGNQTDKRYVARKLVFHEDPQAALVIARDNGIEIEATDEKTFLDEMRYLRVRDWLFDVFWPKPAAPIAGIHEESIGGSLVQVFTKSSAETSEIPFDQIKTKVV
jgi:hypothetical protein